MTETEIQKLFAYQYGLLNNNLVLPNITMGSPGARYEADLIYICELSFYHWLQREYKPGYFETNRRVAL